MPTKPFLILIVEDEPGARILEKVTLQQAGFRVIAVECGEQAITLFEEEPIDLVVLDYRLEDMTAFEVLKAFGKRTEKTPVIVITGYSDPRLAARLIDAGARRFITKDAELAFLSRMQSTVRELLSSDQTPPAAADDPT